MKVNWKIEKKDINKLKKFMLLHNNPFVATRISRNISRRDIFLDRNTILKAILMCLLTSQQRSGPNTPIANFLRIEPFPISIEELNNSLDTEIFIRTTLQKYNLNRYINNISKYFSQIYQYLIITNWDLIKQLSAILDHTSKEEERRLADHISELFKGFGPKQSRNFLQALGLAKYEIPIDSRITNWLNEFGFPILLSSSALQDKGYYHFVSDGIQQLCESTDIYPCVLDAVIFSSFDNGQWSEGNVII